MNCIWVGERDSLQLLTRSVSVFSHFCLSVCRFYVSSSLYLTHVSPSNFPSSLFFFSFSLCLSLTLYYQPFYLILFFLSVPLSRVLPEIERNEICPKLSRHSFISASWFFSYIFVFFFLLFFSYILVCSDL